jgi:hypothetical protein
MRQSFLKIASSAILLACSSSAFAAESASTDLLDTTCTQYLQALNIANPGTKPNPDRAAQAAAAQDDIVQALMWVHGYLTGRDGKAGPSRPLNREWIVTYVGKVATICRSGAGTVRLTDAAAKL